MLLSSALWLLGIYIGKVRMLQTASYTTCEDCIYLAEYSMLARQSGLYTLPSPQIILILNFSKVAASSSFRWIFFAYNVFQLGSTASGLLKV